MDRPIAKDLHVSDILVDLYMSKYVILQGIAPAFPAQMSDVAGHRPVYLSRLVMCLVTNVGLGALNRYAALMTSRCLLA